MHKAENNKTIKNIALNYYNAQDYLHSFNPTVQKFRSQYYENYRFSYINSILLVDILKLFHLSNR